ncbi:complement C4 [Salmo salar]|uniref:Complement C4 n=1 Tax=Salmo salar TaxID=8030 RepID=A0ABM3EVL7_SALSA|nr:complement C4 [Salmo salar]
MGSPVCLMVLFILAAESVHGQDRFFISAPNVFHVGVKERVYVQLGKALLNKRVTLFLEHEETTHRMSQKSSTVCTEEGQIQTVELEVERDKLPTFVDVPHLLLVAEMEGVEGRKMVRVLVSQHRGYIFIQTDQPIYNPTQQVRYRIFTLNHSMRPHNDVFHISIFNAAGNRIMKTLKRAEDGIFTDIPFNIPDVSEMGVWRIVAHYQGDEKNAVTREFQVKKFVLPSFEVTVIPEQSYFLLSTELFNFTILAKYSYGESIKGAFHCRFGLKEETQGPDGEKGKIVFIRGLELTGSIQAGEGSAVLQQSKLIEQLKSNLNITLSDMVQSNAQLYMAVSVTDIISGELQEAEVSLPVVSQRYTVDLSRTRSHYIPGVPLTVVVVVRLPNGSPAVGEPVRMHLPELQDGDQTVKTNQQGAVWHDFNLPNLDRDITVEVTVDDQKITKDVKCASSPGNTYLSVSVSQKILTPGQSLSVVFKVFNGPPEDGFIYYMVFSRGVLTNQGSVKSGDLTKIQLPITSDMTPSFRLIGYYYDQKGDIITDSVWVDVNDVCEGTVEVKSKYEYLPGNTAKLEIDLNGQKAKVALLAVDKAIYALNAHNKLTPKQVFSSMQSYDLGCSYGGGSDIASVLNDAGLSFISNSHVLSKMRKGFNCESGFRRQRRSLNVQQKMMSKKSSYSDAKLQECCSHGFSLIPMLRTCQQRAERVARANKDHDCVKAFLDCCIEGEKLREKKKQNDAQRGHGRTASATDIEDFFDTTNQQIRRSFPPSFAFAVVDINGKGSHTVALPDSITTWEIQAVSLSASHGICVAEPHEFRVFKKIFVSLRLPYSVKRFEEMSIVPVVYNYWDQAAQIALHMERNDKLCSPGSSSIKTYVNITVEAHSSKAVTFSAVPMETGPIPIKIRLYDIENEDGSDAIEKILNVRTEGIEKRVEETHFLDLSGNIGKSGQSFMIDGKLPDNTVPGSSSNIFVKMEGELFGQSTSRTLLSPEGVTSLLNAPAGCAEQTMKRMAPTALALRYLDLSQRWYELTPGTRDTALQFTEQGYMRILTFKNDDGSYGAWTHHPTSYWLTGLVVKVMSLVAERENAGGGEKGRWAQGVSEQHIIDSVRYLLVKQKEDGSFSDPNPVIHREMQGGIGGIEGDVSMTAFITVALNRSLPFLTDNKERSDTKAIISKATDYLLSRVEGLQRPYAVAITAYCLSVCLSDRTQAVPAWEKLKGLATEGKDHCHGWYANAGMVNEEKKRLVPTTEAITVETTAYALLTAVAHKDTEWADSAACWLTSQENYGGGFKSTQDTIVALEALSEYALNRPQPPITKVEVQFTAPRKNDIQKLSLDNKGEKVEIELKKLIGNPIINVTLTGQGKAKMKVTKAYHLLDTSDDCNLLSITVKVEGKVEYTAQIVEDYNDYEGDYGDGEKREEEDVPRSAIEWFDARSRHRRDTQQSRNSENDVEYEVCVSHSLTRNLTGMSIADITLLSGFEAQTDDLDKLKNRDEQYISHYEVSHGKVLLYFNEIEERECVTFRAVQTVAIGLLQPAPATFYDYYEPDRKCTTFYAAPKRSKMVSTLCSGDVCQCSERPCHKEKDTFGPLKLEKKDRFEHACYSPTVDYGFIVQVISMSVKSNFELYTTNVTQILRATGDVKLEESKVRVFAKRLQCKGQLETGKKYLIMGKDGSTTDSNGQMQYLLESNTWIEQVPNEKKCKGSKNKATCKKFQDFVSEYMLIGCTQ